ncbi:hypothetical protein [Amycolatopsis sp. EV170708-02-1]|uniref:hypothetical protein n=1 Tax=Amycolatopsis sp. EV170708-02-1 TaxID=2919322 RepID=UPI001F0CB9D9|nr:hypothetical protein [Amycolatopsis sp. EV170708-02-1]UMP06731.1 hypothetical protein MJQ72_18815 [Amycolatopsis sp. EV170708-02-1]
MEQVLGQASHDHFERGRTERHFVRVPPEFAEPDHVRVRLASGGRWLLHYIRVSTPDTRASYTSGPADVWLTSDTDGTGEEVTLRLTPDQQRTTATATQHARI